MQAIPAMNTTSPRALPFALLAAANVALALALAAGSAGCAQRAAFRAVPTDEGEVYSGFEGAYYELRPQGGDSVGDARLWAEAARDGRGEPPEIRVGLRLRNDSAEGPVEIEQEAFELEVFLSNGQSVLVSNPVAAEGEAAAPPGDTARAELTFHLPGTVDLGDVRAFELSWAVHTPAGRVSESTPFVRSERSSTGNWGYRPYGYVGFSSFYGSGWPYYGYYGYSAYPYPYHGYWHRAWPYWP